MRPAKHDLADYREGDGEPFTTGRSCRSVVRLSSLGRELILMVVLIGVVGYSFAPGNEGGLGESTKRTALRGDEMLLEEVIYAPDGQTVLTSGWDRHVRAWNVREDDAQWGQEVDVLPHDWHIYSIATTPNGDYLAAAGLRGFAVWKRSAQSGWRPFHQVLGPGFRCVAASPDLRTLALGGLDGTVQLWDLATRKATQVLRGLSDDVKSVEFSSRGDYLATSSFKGEFQLWKLTAGQPPQLVPRVPDKVQSFCFAPDDRTVALARWGDDARELILWDYQSGTERLHLARNDSGNNDLAISPDGCHLASADRDRTIRLWDMRSGKLVEAFTDGIGWVKTIAYAPNGRGLVYGGKSGSVQYLELARLGKPGVADPTRRIG